MLLEGIFLPITTPFYPDGRLYLRKLEHNVARYSLTPAAGMLVLGDAGEPGSLTDAETAELLTTAISAAAREKVMIAAVGRGSVFATLALADSAAAAGYDVIAIRSPEFAADPSLHPELMTYFRAVADSSPLPVILLAERTRPMSVQLLGELAAHPAIIGAIDAEASPARLANLEASTREISREVTVTTVFAAATNRMRQTPEPTSGSFVSAETLGSGGSALAIAPPPPALKTRTKRVGFQVLSGSARHMLEAWHAGATGAIPRLSAAAPQACCEVWQAFKDGDNPLAEEKQTRLDAAARLVEGWEGIAALKHACDLNGYFGGRPRLPLLSLTAAQQSEIGHALSTIHN